MISFYFKLTSLIITELNKFCINQYNSFYLFSEKVLWSRRQSDLFLAQQSNLMLHNEKEALDPKIIKTKVDEFLSYDKDYAEAVNIINILIRL